MNIKKQTLILSSLLLSSNLFAGINYLDLKNNINNKRTSERTLKFLKVKNDGTIISILLENYKEDNSNSNKYKILEVLGKNKEISTNVILFKMYDDFDNLKQRLKYQKLLKNINKKIYRKIRKIKPFSKNLFNDYLSENYKRVNIIKFEKESLSKKLEKEIDRLEKTDIKNDDKIEENLNIINDDKMDIIRTYKIPKIEFNKFDINKYDIQSLTRKDKIKLKKIFEEIKLNKNIEKNLQSLSFFGRLVTPILMDTMFDKNSNIRSASIKLLKKNKDLEKSFENIFDEVSFNSKYKYKLYYIEDIKKYETELLNSFNNTTFEVQKEVIKIIENLKLKKIIIDYKKILKKQEVEKRKRKIEELKFLKANKLKKLAELKEKMEREKSKNKLTIREEIELRNSKLKAKYKDMISEEEKYYKTQENLNIINKKEMMESQSLQEETLNERIINKSTRYNAILEAGDKKDVKTIPLLKDIIFDNKDIFTKKEKKQSLFAIIKIGNKECIEVLEKVKKQKGNLSFIASRALKSIIK